MDAFGEAELECLCADGKEVAVRAFHRHGVGEVDEMDGDGAGVAPDGDVEKAGTEDFDDGRFVVGPEECVAEKLEVVGAEDLPEGAVDVEGKVGDAAGGSGGGRGRRCRSSVCGDRPFPWGGRDSWG